MKKGNKINFMTMSIKNFFIVGVVVLSLCLVSCDEHKDFPDTAVKVGHVLCTDGSLLTLSQADSLGKEPYAVVFYVNHEDDADFFGYAVYIKDWGSYALTDSLGVEQGTSASFSDEDGNTNTAALFSCSDVTSPLAQSLFRMWKFRQSAYVPSVAEMRLLCASKTAVNNTLRAMQERGMDVDILPETENDGWYWTSTEVEGQEAYKAWLFSIVPSYGQCQECPKDEEHKCRPVVTVYFN